MKDICFRITLVCFIIAIFFVFIVQFSVTEVDESVKKMFLTGEQSENISDKVYEKFFFKKEYSLQLRDTLAEGKGDINVELNLNRMFAIHFFGKGYVWYKYSCEVYAGNVQLSGSWEIPYRVKIEKRKGNWYVVDSFEKP